MLTRSHRWTLIGLTGFVAATAIGGGLAMLFKVDEFPLEWLVNTPFPDYTIPALVLAGVVGGGSAAAFWAMLRRHPRARLAGMISGALLTGYVTVEVLTLAQVPPGPTPIEIMYLAIGVLIVALSATLGPG